MATHRGNGGNNDFANVNNTGSDKYVAKGGYDTVRAGAGDDTVDGGAQFDRLSYEDAAGSNGATHGATVDLQAATVADPWGGLDVFTNVEMFVGSRFADRFLGHADDHIPLSAFVGGRGNDKFVLSADSNVWVLYSAEQALGGHGGIVADLGAVKNKSGSPIRGTVTDAFGNTDETTNIRKIEGTQHDDTFIGSRLNDRFNGQGGVDSYDGGKGVDMVYFDTSNMFGGSRGIKVDLARTSGQVSNDGFGNTETLESIEGILGTVFADTIKGDSADNIIMGYTGQDKLTGRGGADKFVYGTWNGMGNEFGDTITDFVSGTDRFVFDSNLIDGLDGKVRFRNGTSAKSDSGDSQFYFNAADHTLYLDLDGKGGETGMAIAVLTGVDALEKADITIVPDYMAIA